MSRVTVEDTNAYTGDRKEQRLVVVTANAKKLSELDINAAQPKATHHEDKLVKIGK